MELHRRKVVSSWLYSICDVQSEIDIFLLYSVNCVYYYYCHLAAGCQQIHFNADAMRVHLPRHWCIIICSKGYLLALSLAIDSRHKRNHSHATHPIWFEVLAITVANRKRLHGSHRPRPKMELNLWNFVLFDVISETSRIFSQYLRLFAVLWQKMSAHYKICTKIAIPWNVVTFALPRGDYVRVSVYIVFMNYLWYCR